MEYLVYDLRQKLVQRKANELKRMEYYANDMDKELNLVTTGKIYELEFLIKSLDDLIEYLEKTKKLYSY